MTGFIDLRLLEASAGELRHGRVWVMCTTCAGGGWMHFGYSAFSVHELLVLTLGLE